MCAHRSVQFTCCTAALSSHSALQGYLDYRLHALHSASMQVSSGGKRSSALNGRYKRIREYVIAPRTRPAVLDIKCAKDDWPACKEPGTVIGSAPAQHASTSTAQGYVVVPSFEQRFFLEQGGVAVNVVLVTTDSDIVDTGGTDPRRVAGRRRSRQDGRRPHQGRRRPVPVLFILLFARVLLIQPPLVVVATVYGAGVFGFNRSKMRL